MKTFNAVLRVLAALAAVAGAIYLVATYGEQIVAWAKKLWANMPCPCSKDAEVCEEAVAEEAPVEEAAAEEVPVEEPVAEEVVVEEPVAEEADFAE